VLHRRWGLSRLMATAITVGLLALVGSTAALSNSLLAETLIFGRTFFDLYDWLTSNLLLPLGGIAICLFAGWVWGAHELRRAVSNDGALANGLLVRVLLIALRYIAPALILLVLLHGLGVL
jgi:neurotransmitter:Na+ symporter, NSS family